jgi:hypothetical protein
VPPDEEADLVRGTWWLHDACWFASVARRFGLAAANEVNQETLEKTVRGMVLQLRRRGILSPPASLEELCDSFYLVWRLLFPDGIYLDTTFEISGDVVEWVGHECQAYEQIRQAGWLKDYSCGCRAVRTGFARGMGIRLDHRIEESLVAGDGRCVVRFRLGS